MITKKASGTSFETLPGLGTYVTAHLLCSDGKVRKVKRIAPFADTALSVPCAIVAHGKTIDGYMTDSDFGPQEDRALVFRP